MGHGTWLGFDYGLRRIGVAVGQTLTGTASPLRTLQAVGPHPDWDSIAGLIGEWRPEGLVVGLPLNMDGTEEEETAPRARRFARQLQGRFGLPVHLIDERLSTREAQRLTGPGSARTGLDAYAAKLILESWLSERDTQGLDA